jgi:hypothetical protein
MMRILTISIVLSLFLARFGANAQFSKENSGEIIFGFSDVEKNGLEIPTKMRFSLFFHAGQNYHYDFNNNFGFYTGYGIRNIGIITDENDIIYKRRTYSLGVPLAIKVGSFKDHINLYAGGEYELFFHYKQKQFINGNKNKYSRWFSDRTKRFAPSYFAGIQFPGGINLKFKYYPQNFLNQDFEGYDFGNQVDYSDYNKTQLFYIALSFNFNEKDIKKLYNPDGQPGRIAAL